MSLFPSAPADGVFSLPPDVAADAAPYWEAAARGELQLQRCLSCQKLRYYPRPVCPYCGTWGGDWERLSGRGTIYSYTRIRRIPNAMAGSLEPFVIVLVDLDEGPRMLTRLVDADISDVRIGERVQAVFQPLGDIAGPAIPHFVRESPATRGSAGQSASQHG